MSTTSAQAATVLGVVSERAAPETAEAAQAVLAARSGDRIVLRTPQQLEALDKAQLQQLVAGSDAVIAVALFGEQGVRLRETAQRLRRQGHGPRRLYAFHGESGLAYASYDERRDLRALTQNELGQLTADAPPPALLARARADAFASEWLDVRALWREGGQDNLRRALRFLLDGGAVPKAQPQPDLILRQNGTVVNAPAADARPLLAVLDLNNADTVAGDALCARAQARGLACLGLYARWGEASLDAVQRLPALLGAQPLAGLVVLQDFVVGAAEGRDAASTAIAKLDVPVFKAIRMLDRSAAQWRLSGDGLPISSVQYRVAMSELQGSSQPMVLAAAGPARIDPLTGVRLQRPQALAPEIDALVERALRWRHLRETPPAQRKIALIYYNHPPGRQNIGADNLDVPASLHGILRAMRAQGYAVDGLPETPDALLDAMMRVGVNTPEDNGELAALAQHAQTMSGDDYRRWFATLPESVRGEVSDGPLARLRAQVALARAAHETELGERRVREAERELLHLLEGIDHPSRDAALAKFRGLIDAHLRCLKSETDEAACAEADAAQAALQALNIPGLRGWGAAPGKVMTHGDAVVLPGLRLGNVFIGPQPPRGWEVDEELLHANTQIPPPHQYLAYYHWLRDVFRADAIVHVGRHSTYEFLPGKAVGLASDDYSRLIAGDVPGVYPYIVDGVGEGTQAKRRGLAVMVDHLTPPLAATALYDRLLTLRQLVESFESSTSEPLRAQAAAQMREQVEALQLRAELEASMADVLKVRGIGFEQTDDDLLAHEIGHYLTKLQEKFMPHGLHVFGQAWEPQQLDTMLDSMRGLGEREVLRDKLKASPPAEMAALLHGLDGGFVLPGKGNDPLRAPESLPTGRNFHGLDGDVLPSPLAQRLGAEQAARVLAQSGGGSGSEAVVLWASDAVRDEGVMVGFSLALMGVQPRWNARGIVQGLELKPMPAGQTRRDVIVTTSGLFRDLYPNLVVLLDRGGRMALAASAQRLRKQRPELGPALDAALAPLGEQLQTGDEPIDGNGVAREWVQRTDALRGQGLEIAAAGREAAWRIFGDAPGAYGAGVNRLTERSGAWRDRGQIGRAYLNRMGHAYGLDADGIAAHRAFETGLRSVARTYHGRASHLYGLLDNNDAFDYFGGLSLAAETLTGRVPQAQVLYNADADRADVEPLEAALLREFRGRYLNPQWIRPLMRHGYAGARTMSQEFLENLWGWQVTRPDVIHDWAWDEVQSVYLDDKHKLGVNDFLSRGHAQQAKAHMLALMLVAAHKGFWHTPEANVRRLGGELTELVARNGLPGSGHAAPDHPMWAWLRPKLLPAAQAQLDEVLARARGERGAVSTFARGAAERARIERAAVRAEREAQAPAQPEPAPARAPAKPVAARPAAAKPAVAAAAPPRAERVSELTRMAPAELARRHPIPAAIVGLLVLALIGFGLRRGLTAR
ncbi:cobaltochelatase subunit CobN [Lysobacter sp. K5869]|uniref:cobaltochelatase subunit CobN n=1 Tax=Lysobacter sp. K5869 TaxID=2820808 RepID=UPI001C061E23|nr:cobaltochelatase subunit CobN [Lysobacter sp. K5869]QWP76312.1 cobaltochelatase subunit CobN [Lysobacter sp. K5869]